MKSETEGIKLLCFLLDRCSTLADVDAILREFQRHGGDTAVDDALAEVSALRTDRWIREMRNRLGRFSDPAHSPVRVPNTTNPTETNDDTIRQRSA